MKINSACFGPYRFSSPDFSGDGGTTFVDNTKTRQVVVITKKGQTPSLPSPDAVVLHETVKGECSIQWYECPNTLGRTYTLMASGCEVFITAFENGFLSQDECDGLEYGSASYCFGKIHDEGGFDADDCFVSFEFEGHRFNAQGNLSYSFGAYDCSGCWPIDFEAMAWNPDISGDQDLPEAPPEAEQPTVEDTIEGVLETGDSDDDEIRIDWNNGPSSSAGTDTYCDSEQEPDSPTDCESRDNPSVATLPSGHAVIAYEARDDDGSLLIKLSLLNTTVENSIFYYRRLSRGRLLNNDEIAYGSGTFEIYDDVYISVTNDTPDETLYIGFLSGPLVGGDLFRIQSAIREQSPDGRYRWSFKFDSGARAPEFVNSNHASDVKFIITQGSLSNPTIGDLFTLPAHLDENNNIAPVAYPTLAVAHNAHMVDTSQNLFLSYEAFINNQWNVYVQHIRLTERTETNPTYKAPYIFQKPNAFPKLLSDVTYPEVIFRAVDEQYVHGWKCVLFEVFTNDNKQVINCNETEGSYTHTCGLVANTLIATVEINYNPPSSNWPSIGDEFAGSWNPIVADTFCPADPSQVATISQYPLSISDWCIYDATCTQYFLFDDPYCPSPYVDFIDVQYKPVDLWNIKVNDDIVSRVKYNMSATVTQQFQTEGISASIDFMFVIDHSASMSSEIGKVRIALPILAQNLIDAGFDVRFGLCIYGRRGPNPAPDAVPFDQYPDDVGAVCDDYQQRSGGGTISKSGPSQLFDGLQGSSFCGLPQSEETGFTRSVDLFSQFLNCWWEPGYARAQHWSAIQFALEDTTRFSWRDNASKFVFLVTDTDEEEVPGDNQCGPYSDVKTDAINSILAAGAQFIVSRNPATDDIYSDISILSGWQGEPWYDINLDDYGVVFENIAQNIVVNLSGLTILERDTEGYNPTFMKPAEMIVTYSGDLSDIWTNERSSFVFSDVPPIDLTRADKGLSNLPYVLYNGQIYGADNVHVSANFANWVYFDSPGRLRIDYPEIGVPEATRTDPLLIASNARRPRIRVNNQNSVLVAYETIEFGIPEIRLKGTGDLHYGGIIGPAGGRITKILAEEDFVFNHDVTLSGEGINQLVDFIVDDSDVCHMVWQSNRDGSWDIYYANSSDLFEPVRVTKSPSRSSAPKIDVADDGTIYVVYQDNRFGPFEVFLSYKDERRFLPLVQQDAYLASLREAYRHHTNTMPILISNTGRQVPADGLLWATKTAAAGSGNSFENYIFSIPSPSLNVKLGGGDTTPYDVIALAGARDGYIYGVTSDNILLQIAAPSEEPYQDIDPGAFIELGTIPLLDSQTITDMTIDNVGNIWIAVVEQSSIASLKMFQVTGNGLLLRESVIYASGVTDEIFGVTCFNDGEFYFTSHRSGVTKFSRSDYPFLGSGAANFVVEEIGDLTPDIKSLASDFEDTIYGVDDLNTIYEISVLGSTTQLADLTPPQDPGQPEDGADPIQDLSGFGYQFSGRTTRSGDDGYFHVLIEFFDNLNLEGNPVVTVDSRNDLEAFVNVQIEDPYVEEAYITGAGGIFLTLGESKYVGFDAAHYRPQYTNLSYPYAFETNQTYFPKVYVIAPDNSISLVEESQLTSFSCSKCSSLGDNTFDYHGCSFSWTIETPGEYNFYVDFFADKDYINNLERYMATYGSSELPYFEVNNFAATRIWGQDGLEVREDEPAFIQVYPTLNVNTGLLCGITYYARVTNADTSEVVSEGTFFCECSGNVFRNGVQALSSVGRWHSSAHGYADTRVTDSPQDSMRPSVKTRSSGAAIIAFEDYEYVNSPKIRAATFRKAAPEEFFSSGTKAWFDYDFGIFGNDVNLTTDVYDRPIMTYERQQPYPDGDLPRNSVYLRACNFAEISSITDGSDAASEMELVLRDEFIVADLIKQVTVNPDDVEYYTYNVANDVAPVVSKCRIRLQIWGTPEIVAYRLRNEGNSAYSSWCTAAPEITNFMTEAEWHLTQGSGAKDVCVQAMTYNGITAEFCVPIVADYATTTFEIRLYSDDSYLSRLPTSDGMYVAATRLDLDTGETSTERTVYLEILPSAQIDGSIVNYDVIQQGSNDLFDQIAQEAFADGRQVFRGSFTINKEDNVLNVDGLARIRARFADECQAETQIAFGSYSKDDLNLTLKVTQLAEVEAEDIFDPYRQDISGRIGAGMTLRPNEDPYLIFGDPSFFLKQSDPDQKGVAQADDDSAGGSGSPLGDGGG